MTRLTRQSEGRRPVATPYGILRGVCLCRGGGRDLAAQAIDLRSNDPKAKVTGIRERLAAHRRGRRSGDQFAVYVFDRLVLDCLTQEQVAAAVAGSRKLDDECARVHP